MENMEYLYRYTTIENLALTLKNRTIRLNPLDKMDDLQEQRSSDIDNIGRFFFISSWTADETESIPMWNMYTNIKSGVRIKLPKNPFLRHKTTGASLTQQTGMIAKNKESFEYEADTFLELGELLSRNVFSPQAWNGEILHEVIYTDDEALLEPKVYNEDGKGYSFSFDKIGRYKNTYWSFQKEWRYLMQFMTFSFDTSPEESLLHFQKTAERMAAGTEPPPFRYYDLEIAPEYFSQMEITPSPQMSSGCRIILDALVAQYNPTATITESKLLGLVNL